MCHTQAKSGDSATTAAAKNGMKNRVKNWMHYEKGFCIAQKPSDRNGR